MKNMDESKVEKANKMVSKFGEILEKKSKNFSVFLPLSLLPFGVDKLKDSLKILISDSLKHLSNAIDNHKFDAAKIVVDYINRYIVAYHFCIPLFIDDNLNLLFQESICYRKKFGKFNNYEQEKIFRIVVETMVAEKSKLKKEIADYINDDLLFSILPRDYKECIEDCFKKYTDKPNDEPEPFFQ